MVIIEELSEVEASSSSSSYYSAFSDFSEVEAASSAGDHHIRRCKYDVFLSFRGEDTRNTFVDHLYSALERSGIYTFKDDERLETGESISPALLKAIEESSFAVIVFSKNFASSRWCLDELVKVMECSSKSPKGQTVIPIFYDVKPSDVRKQEGHFGEMFRKHDSDRVQSWRKALTDAANLSGLELSKTANGRESKFINRIVQKIWSKLPSKIKVEDEGLVGMKSRIKEVTLLLGKESNVVRTVAIWGLSGIGKSTLARAVYGQIKDQFKAACFLEDVGEVSKKDGLTSLQQRLLSRTLGVKDLPIADRTEGSALMKTRLRSISVLLVLDDVDSSEQLEELAGSHEWFGPGSRIIITTRDKNLLGVCNEVQIHDASLLDNVEATKLFRWKAFKDKCPAKDFEELSVQVIEYCGGLPLALKVLGSALRGKELDFWIDTLKKLRKGGNILEKLKIGFDGLEESERNTFLDIACFFGGGAEEDVVTRKLGSFDFYPGCSIRILVDKSLIHCSYGMVCMHQLIREMGWYIVRQKYPGEPGKYSRLWDTSDIEKVLTRNKGTENIEGILLHPHEREYTIEMGTNAFRKMDKLRLLEIHNACIPISPDYLPDELRWIDWDKYPSNYLPTTFEADILVGLRLRCSRLKQLWEGRTKKKKLKNLKYVDLSYSRNLVGTSHLGEASNLEDLILKGCTSLVKVDPSIGFLKKLVCLNLAGCKNLVILPSTLCMLKGLKSLILSGCSKFEKLPEEIGKLECLEELLLDGTAVTEPPPSIGCLKNLKNLSFGNISSQSPASIFQYLFQLSKRQKTTRSLVLAPIWGLTSLTQLDLSDCNLSEGAIPGDLGSLSSLEWLYLGGNNFENLPSLGRLSQLVCLVLDHCEMILELPELPSRISKLFADNCASLRVSVDRLATCKIKYGSFQNCGRKLLDYGESEIVASTLWQPKLEDVRQEITLTGRVIPEWFCNHTFTEHSVSLKLPQNWYYNPKFKGYSFFVILEAINKVDPWAVMDLLFTEPGHHHPVLVKSFTLLEGELTGLEHTIIGYNTFSVPDRHICRKCRWYKRAEIEVSIRPDPDRETDTLEVKKWGVRMVFDDDDNDNDITMEYGDDEDDITTESDDDETKKNFSEGIGWIPVKMVGNCYFACE